MNRSEVLADADRLIHGERQQNYGDAADSFGATAAMWSAYLGCGVTARDVCNMMALLKIASLRLGQHDDSSVDGCGYLALGAEVAG